MKISSIKKKKNASLILYSISNVILQCMEDFKLKIKSASPLNANSSVFSFHLNFFSPVGEGPAFLDRICLEMDSSVKALHCWFPHFFRLWNDLSLPIQWKLPAQDSIRYNLKTFLFPKQQTCRVFHFMPLASSATSPCLLSV